MNRRVLFVDDDPNVLAAFRRTLYRTCDVFTADDPDRALSSLTDSAAFAAVVSDLAMPGMDGIAFLSTVRTIAPHTTRIMLTGHGDLRSATEALHRGHIFRFLTKPCAAADLIAAIEAGIEQHRLVTAERDLLQKTLSGSVRMLMEILSMLDPELFGDAQKLRSNARAVARAILGSATWEMELATMLMPIGFVSVPTEVTAKWRVHQPLTEVEQRMVDRVPEIGKSLLANVPRLERVAQIVYYRHKHFDGTGIPDDRVRGDDIPIESRILAFVTDLAEEQSAGLSLDAAARSLASREGWYDPNVVTAAEATLAVSSRARVVPETKTVMVADLRSGDTFARPVEKPDGTILISEGQVVSRTLIEKLLNLRDLKGLKEPVCIRQAQLEAAPGPLATDIPEAA